MWTSPILCFLFPLLPFLAACTQGCGMDFPMAAVVAALGYQPLGSPPGASALSWAAPRVRGQQKTGSRVWGAETQGAKQLLLWHKGSEGTPIRRVSQAARAWRWVSWRCGPARSPVQGPRRLHSHL